MDNFSLKSEKKFSFGWMGSLLVLSFMFVFLTSSGCENRNLTREDSTQPTAPQPPTTNPTPPVAGPSPMGLISDEVFMKINYSKDFGLVGITAKGTLKQFIGDKWKVLADKIAPKSRIGVGHGRLSVVGENHELVVVNSSGQPVRSRFKVSPTGGFVHLAHGTILIALEESTKNYHLARVEGDNTLTIKIRKDRIVLEDAVPLQIDLGGTNDDNGHIAVLYEPSTEYQHGVLGDATEAKSIMYVERHSLDDLKGAYTLPVREVFEDNELRAYDHKIVTIVSGEGKGAALALLDGNMKLSKGVAISSPYRWMSPFVYNGKLYSIHMPHLSGLFYRYNYSTSSGLTYQINNPIDSRLSNHKIGQRHLNNSATTKNKLAIFKFGYQDIAIYNGETKEKEINLTFDGLEISSDGNDTIFVLGAKGEIYAFKI